MATIPKSIQEIINEYLNKIGRQIKLNKVILFGSYAKGEFNENSDIDLAVFSDDFIGMEPIERFRFLFLQATEYGVDFQALPFTTIELKDPEGLVAEILQTGIEVAASE